MYTLFYSPSTASTAAHWMLIELDVPFDLRLVDFEARQQKSPEFLALNPSGHVPVLVIEGRPHAELAALLMLLAERHPERSLAPAPSEAGRADYLQRMLFLANTVQPAFRAWFYPHEPAGAENAAAVQAAARVKLEAVWDQVEAWFEDGRHYALGDRLTALDFLLTILMRWSRNLPRPATGWPRLKAYADRMRTLPSLREVHAREGLTDWIND